MPPEGGFDNIWDTPVRLYRRGDRRAAFRQLAYGIRFDVDDKMAKPWWPLG
jgi:hypothetical protein